MNRFSPQNWEQAKAVFIEALERSGAERAEYLNSACGEDTALRAEVESLLRSFEVAGSFMESPAVESAAESLIENQEQLQTGQQVKHYEILSHIAQGGMGEVYLARDLMLGRRVALKFLPDYLRHDPERMRRFKQEARAASTLSHPNVCVIHEVSETDDRRPFITMEYIEGITLRQRLNEGPIPIDEALQIAVQVADALTAAHDSGVVHRDIKPENIMIRRDGYVKVLDFGLAKLTDHRAPLNSTLSTLMLRSSPGMVMGTAAYMSPEQARGVNIDARSDVWSLGVVLYEMATGNAPFVGATPTDIVIAIVEREQLPLSEYVTDVPTELERIVRKALRKDPEQRYQLVKEMAIDLRSLQRDLDIHQSVAPERATSARKFTATGAIPGRQKAVDTDELKSTRRTVIVPAIARSKWGAGFALLLAAAVLTVVFFAFYKAFRRTEQFPAGPLAFQQIEVTKLTTNGNALFATISPDGKYVGYIKAEGGKESLWLRQVGSAGNLEVIPAREGHYRGITFSPDGDFILYAYDTISDDNVVDIFKVPTLGTGATPIKIAANEGPASLSHDGRHKAFMRLDEAQQMDILNVANADGSREQVVLQRKWPVRLFYDYVTLPAWSKDDQTLTIPSVTNDGQGYMVSLIEVRLADRSERKFALAPYHFEQPYHITILSDGSGVVLSGRAQGASFSQIWFLGLDGSARPITSDLSDYGEASLTAKSNALVTVQRQTLSNIFVAPRGDTSPTQITSGVGRYFDVRWAPDGKILYASDGSGIADIYELSADGASSKQLTSGMKRNYAPTVSADNRFIAFHSNRSGNFQIWRMDRDGSNPVQLTDGNVESNWPCFSPDSKWVYYQHFEQGSASIWKVPIEGGKPTKVIDTFSIRPVVSPDGKWLTFWQIDGQPNSRWRLGLISLDDPTNLKRFDLSPTVTVQWDTQLRWTPDSKNVTYIDQKAGVDNVWAQPIDGGAASQITNFVDSRIFAFDWSRTGTLAASRGLITSDVVLIADKQR